YTASVDYGARQARDFERRTQREMNLLSQAAGLATNIFSHMSGSAKKWADVTVQAFQEVITAILQKDLTEKQSIITTAALKAAHYAAQALADLGDGNFWAAAKHAAAAAAFGAVAAAPIVSAAVGASSIGGGGGG